MIFLKKSKKKVYIPSVNNAGDKFNFDLMKYFRVNMERVERAHYADLLMLGGGISNLQNPKNPLNNNSIHIWGTGFLFGDNNDFPLSRPNMVVHALRGKLSKEKLSRLLNISLPESIPLADPGLLASYFADPYIEKKYDIGIIPHRREQNSAEVKHVLRLNPDMHFIDITLSPREVIREIQMCKSVVSGSLHGLVFSDSLSIPNVHVRFTELPLGGSFKFRDYYSSFNLSDPALKPDDISGITPGEITDHYEIDRHEVEKKKLQLVESFPKFFQKQSL